MGDGIAKVTSADVCMALKLRYPRESHALMFEVAPTTGGGTRYADAVAVGLWRSHGHGIEGIEVKVSRADFLNEMKQPEKSQPVFQFCNRWWLACPKDMVKPEELPPTWGLLELCAGALRQKVKAPKLDPVPITMGFFAAMIRRHAGMDEEMTKLTVRAQMADYEKLTRARLEQHFEHRFSTRQREAEAGLSVLVRVKEETGIDLSDWQNRDDRLLSAVKLVQSLAGDYSGIKDLRRSAASLVEAVDASGLLSTPQSVERGDG